jgi:hypothetical protein
MAKITSGSTVSETRGKVGGLVFLKSRGGKIVRALKLAIAGAANQVYRIPPAGGNAAFGQVDISQEAAVTGTLAVAHGGTGTATGSITGTGALTFAAGGANQNVTLTPSGTGNTILNGKDVQIGPNALPIPALAGRGLMVGRDSFVEVGAYSHCATLSGNTAFRGMSCTGTFAAPGQTKTAQGTFFGLIGHDGTNYISSSRAIVALAAAENWTPTAQGARIEFSTVAPGTTTRTLRAIISANPALDVTGNIRASSQLISTVATGTAPLAVTSTTEVANLNADRVGGTEITNAATAGQVLVGSGAGTAAWGTPDGARVYNNADESIANLTETALTFNTERYDNGGLHEGVTNPSRLTAQKAGVYVISVSIRWEANATGSRSLKIVIKGADSIAHDRRLNLGTAYVEQTVTTVYHLAAADYVEAFVMQDSGGALKVQASSHESPEFAMQWLGP